MDIEAKERNQEDEKEKEKEEKLVVICRMCNQNFKPGPYGECPYLYHPELGMHIPLCNICRGLITYEAEKD